MIGKKGVKNAGAERSLALGYGLKECIFVGMRFLVSVLLCNSFFLLSGCWSNENKGFPYDRSSAEVQIRLKPHTSQADRRSVYTVTAGDVVGEIEVIAVPAQGAGQSIAHSQMVGIKSTFESMIAPYGGQITSRIECNARKYVKEQIVPFAGKETPLILAVANERRTFGACSPSQVKQAAAFWAAYDEKSGNVVTLTLFKPIASMAEIEESQQKVFQVFRKIIH